MQQQALLYTLQQILSYVVLPPKSIKTSSSICLLSKSSSSKSLVSVQVRFRETRAYQRQN